MIKLSSPSGKGKIPQYSTDPTSPAAESAWVLATGVGGTGTPVGLLLAITVEVFASYTYALKYRTAQGTTLILSDTATNGLLLEA